MGRAAMTNHPPRSTDTDQPKHLAPEVGQFALLRQKRFAWFFWTQFFGAANDNLFKFALTVMVTYQLQVAWLPASVAGLWIGAIFILPFLLFSATAGQLADKYEKGRIIRRLKLLEVGIMVVAAAALYWSQVAVLLGCIFFMGVQSALFGPVKYAYLPQHLGPHELTGGNGMVEMGTFVAILLGSLAGGALIAQPEVGRLQVALGCLLVALAGWAVSWRIPLSRAIDEGLRINWNPFTETWRNLRLARENKVVFRSLLGISWMWFVGAILMSQFPSIAKDTLHGNAQVASLLLVIFAVGVGAGSLLCEVLSRKQVEIGLVPVGALGMGVFLLDLYFATRSLPAPAELLTISGFVAQAGNWRVMVDLALLCLFIGLYSVPMYALVQLRAQPSHRARIIAANNILNALFMVASALFAALLLNMGLSMPQLFLVLAVLHTVVAGYIFLLVPEYLLRFIAWVMAYCVYRFSVRGRENIPARGAAVVVCNHVSFADAILLMAASPRPIYFLMDGNIFKNPVLGFVFRMAKAIPIYPKRDNTQAFDEAFARAQQVLQGGGLLGIFPEGAITRNGEVLRFRKGVKHILDNASQAGLDVPVVPMALSNLWGSFFSRIEERNGQRVAMVKPFRRGVFNRVGLDIGPVVPGHEATPELLQQKVTALFDAANARTEGKAH